MEPLMSKKRINDAYYRRLAEREAGKAAGVDKEPACNKPANNKRAQQHPVPVQQQPVQSQLVQRQTEPPAQPEPVQRLLAKHQPAPQHRPVPHPPRPSPPHPQPAITRQTPPDNHRTRHGPPVPRPSRPSQQQGNGPTSSNADSWFVREVSPIIRGVPTIEEAGCWRWGFKIAGAVVSILWTIAECVLKALWWPASIVIPIVLSFLLLAFLAGWAVEGLHAVQVRACNDILPNRFFFADWCDSINTASSPPPRPTAASSKLPSSPAGNPLVLTESFALQLQKPDRHFYVFAFGDILGAIADEQQKYMTERQRESFAPLRRAGAAAGELQSVGRKQARTVERAQEKMMNLLHNPAAMWSKHDPPPPPPPPSVPPEQRPAAWWWWWWFLSLFAKTQQPPSVPPPSVTLQQLVREILRVLQGEVTSRRQFGRDATALSQEIGEIASNVCSWNTVLEERISDKTHRLVEGEARHRVTATSSRLGRIFFIFLARCIPWTNTMAAEVTADEVLMWEDQAEVIRGEITKWRRRKSKANVLCKVLTEGASKTAILLKAIHDEQTHLGEMVQGAEDLLGEVIQQEGKESSGMLQHWSKTARDLCLVYLKSFQQHYPKC